MKNSLIIIAAFCAIVASIFAGAAVYAAPAAPDGMPPTRPLVIDFPNTYSMGELYLLKAKAEEGDSEPPASTHFPARGRMKFPPGTRLQLRVGFEGAHHMAELGKLPPNALFSVYMRRTEVSDDDLKHVARLSELRHVDLEGTDISDKGVFNLEPLKKLAFLGVDKTTITGEAIKSIGKHVTLLSLVIGHNDLDDECYKHLNSLKKLRMLQIDNTHISDKGVAYAAKLPALQVVKLSGNNRVTDRTMALFANTKVKFINVQKTGVGIGSLPHFLKMPKLDGLKLEGRNFTPEQKKEMQAKLPRVKLQFFGKERDFPKELFDPLH
jgi:hypothetical protein